MHARACRRADVPPTTKFVPLPARVLLRSWANRDTPRIDSWLRPARVIHATNYLAPPSRLPVLVSVYDCSFVRYPELCTPEVRAFEPILRRAVRSGATIHTGSAFVAGEIEEIFGSGLRAAGRLLVIPLGVPALGDASRLPADLAARVDHAPFVLAIGSLEPRKNLPHLVGAFGELAGRDDTLRLVIAGADGPARPAVDAAIARLPAPARDRVIVTGAVDNAARRALLDRAAVARVSVDLRRVRFSRARGDERGRAGGRGSRRFDSRGRGRRRAARRADRRARARVGARTGHQQRRDVRS